MPDTRSSVLAIFAIRCILTRLLRETQMPTRNISLTAEQDAFVQDVVEAGEYQNASEAIRDALRVLQQRRKEDGLRLKALRAQIKVGIDALDRGDFAEIEDVDLEGYLERLTTPRGEARAVGPRWRGFGSLAQRRSILPTSSRQVPSGGAPRVGNGTPPFSPPRCGRSRTSRKARLRRSDPNSVQVSAASTSDIHAVLLKKTQGSGDRFTFSTIASPRKV